MAVFAKSFQIEYLFRHIGSHVLHYGALQTKKNISRSYFRNKVDTKCQTLCERQTKKQSLKLVKAPVFLEHFNESVFRLHSKASNGMICTTLEHLIFYHIPLS